MSSDQYLVLCFIVTFLAYGIHLQIKDARDKILAAIKEKLKNDN